MTILTTLLKAAAANYNNHHGVKLKKLAEHGDYNLGAGIYRDTEAGEFVCFFFDGGDYLFNADYHTSDRADAEKTVAIFVDPHKGEDTGVDPKDGDVVGIDNDGNAVCYNGETGATYNSGEPPTEEERASLPPAEVKVDAPLSRLPAPRGFKYHTNPLLAGLLMRI